MGFQVIQMAPRTLSWWRDEREDIDFAPVYQRKGHIWSEKQQQFLIDSILNGFDVPKLYVADFTFFNSALNEKRRKYAVVDGKQRLTTILRFFDGDVLLPKDFVYSEDPSLQLQGLSYLDLATNHPKIARRFDNASLTVMSVITDDEAKINELFIRLNSSKPLTGAELRNAMTGPLPQFIRQIAEHDFFVTRIRFSVSRSQDRNTAAKLLLLEHKGAVVDTKKAQLDALAKEVDDPDPDVLTSAFEEAAEETQSTDIERSALRTKEMLSRLCKIFVKDDELLKRQADVIVIYWLARDLPPDQLRQVRPFLVQFDLARTANKGSGEADSELAHYELLARTINDANSIKMRHQILSRRFSVFVKTERPA